VPFPSSPSSLAPQHATPPEAITAQALLVPADTCDALDPTLAEFIIHVNDALLDGPLASVAVTVTFEVAAVVGMPLISPLPWLIESPAGRHGGR